MGRGKKRLAFLLGASGIMFSFLLGLSSAPGWSKQGEVFILNVDGPISPGTASYLSRGIEEAEKSDATLAVVYLDTPGGLASSMRTMVKAILNSRAPVVVYVLREERELLPPV